MSNYEIVNYYLIFIPNNLTYYKVCYGVPDYFYVDSRFHIIYIILSMFK